MMISKYVAAMLLLAIAGAASAEEPPALPFHAKNKCPFEGCVYRAWTALRDVPAYDSPSDTRQRTGTIHKGEKVTGLGGVVITYRPGSIHVDRDIPEQSLKRGDNILTYTYAGEGFSQVWINGRFYEEFDISFTKWPDGTGCGNAHCAATYVDLGKKIWWAQVKLKSGVTMWIEMDAEAFAGVYLLASPDVPAL
ncbi:MAG: hypothetical protein WDO18_20485 [Acidobacteriota bacterium]